MRPDLAAAAEEVRAMRAVLSRLLAGGGAVLLLLGLVAGVVNREVIDGQRFAASANAVRRDPAVSQRLGEQVTRELVRRRPDLVAVRPLLESATAQLVRSPAFDGIVTAAVRDVHDTVLGQARGGVVFRLADVGAVVAAALPAVVPGAGRRVPPDLQVTLARVGSTSASDATVRLVRLSSTAAWTLPVLALLALLGSWLLAADRWHGAARVGWAVAAAGVGVGLVGAAGAVAATSADRQTLRGAVLAATWRQVRGDLWTVSAVFAATGMAIAVVAAPGAQWTRATALAASVGRHALLRRPATAGWRVVRGLGFVAVAAALVLWPAAVAHLALVLTAVGLAAYGLGEVAASRPEPATDPGTGEGPPRARRPLRAVLVTVPAVALLVATAGWHSAPVSTIVPVVGGTACNGSVRLCDRRYDDVAFPAAHNAMSAADEPGWFLAEQPTGILGGLQAGVRVFLMDAWYGQTTRGSNVVVTAPTSLGGAVASAKQDFRPEVVASALRLRDALVTSPQGPVRPYLCHGLCELGATEWEPVMREVAAWMAQHPREVVTFFIEDHVQAVDVAAVFRKAGLLPWVHVQPPGRPWPTLRRMIDSGRRLVVLTENRNGGADHPWILPGFREVQDTPYTNPTYADLSCRLNRGRADNPLFMVNYWLANFDSLVSDARKVNALDRLSPYLSRCRRERGQIPNYVAVNHYDQGDLFLAVDRLNRLR